MNDVESNRDDALIKRLEEANFSLLDDHDLALLIEAIEARNRAILATCRTIAAEYFR